MAKKINTEMELRKVKLSDLVPYENNPRNNDEAVPDVEESMVQTGYNSPIVVSKDMVILARHTRLKSLLDAGVEEAPVVVIDRTAEQYKKFRILDNKTGEKASWDFEKLKFELDGLNFDGFDFGFDLQEFETSTLKNTSGEYDVDDFDDENFECTCPKCGFKFNPKGE